MQYRNIPNITVENARIMFRNFAGRADQYNKEGDRSFCWLIEDSELANRLNDDGWNIKVLKPREEGDEPRHYLNVAVSFRDIPGIRPMNAFMIAGRNKIRMTQESIDALDYAEIINCDLEIRPYQWEAQGRTGVKAYLQTGYFTIEEDPFASKYAEEEAPEEVPFD